ncbi:hypothetical protein AB1Y20_013557 [Prymnesium parvum]|uniref:Timeless N-terminal domain-containing protein n=1 Tax=Prymnesium parvum TaxID=97485 RepID=A0AB34IHN3_PRYPA
MLRADTHAATDLDPNDEEELLLIIAGMGFPQPPSDDGVIEYWIGEETHDCVSDLQRYLRRDDPHVMATHRALGLWKTMQLHLIPLLRTCGEEHKVAFNVLKLVVKLTMKPEQLGSRIADHLKERKIPDPQMGKYMSELQAYHQQYKKAFLTGDAMGTVVRLLGSCLNEPSHSRTDEQVMIIELILALLLNLLHTYHPDAPHVEAGRTSERLEQNALLRKLVIEMEREHLLDLLLFILQQVEESPMIRAWNLTLLEITYYILSSHSPQTLYAPTPSAKPTVASEPAAPIPQRAAGTPLRGGDRAPPTVTPPSKPAATLGALGGMLLDRKAGRDSLLTQQSGRHGRFGGAFKVRSDFGTEHVLGRINSSGECALPQPARKRTVKAKMPVAGALAPRASPESEAAIKKFVSGLALGPFNLLASTVIKDLEGFAFGSTANNSSKVLPQDHTFFAATASWFLEAQMLQQDAHRAHERSQGRGALLDVSTVSSLAAVDVFQLALRLCREFEEKKHWLQLNVYVSLLKQLFCFLDQMVRHGDNETARVAVLLRRNVFYEGEVMKLLETLTKAYEPFHMPSTYMADCVVMTHAVLRQLESYGSSGDRVLAKRKKRKGGRGKKSGGNMAAGGEDVDGEDGGRDGDDDDGHGGASIEEIEFDFDKSLYDFCHQPAVIERYIALLANFTSLSAPALHGVVKFITRVIKQCKLEPMLFQISTLQIVCGVLEHPASKLPQFEEAGAVCKFIARRFFEVAKSNPAVFVEACFWTRHTECEMICNGYESRLPKRARRQVEEGVQHDEAEGGAQLPAARKKKGKWRAEEDELLREQFELYSNVEDWHHVIAAHLAPRTAVEVRNRARVLKLCSTQGPDVMRKQKAAMTEDVSSPAVPKSMGRLGKANHHYAAEDDELVFSDDEAEGVSQIPAAVKRGRAIIDDSDDD